MNDINGDFSDSQPSEGKRVPRPSEKKRQAEEDTQKPAKKTKAKKQAGELQLAPATEAPDNPPEPFPVKPPRKPRGLPKYSESEEEPPSTGEPPNDAADLLADSLLEDHERMLRRVEEAEARVQELDNRRTMMAANRKLAAGGSRPLASLLRAPSAAAPQPTPSALDAAKASYLAKQELKATPKVTGGPDRRPTDD